MQAHLRALAALVAVAALVALGLSWTIPPAPVPASAPGAEFSSARARAHLEVVAARPHPIGSAEHERVRAYLLDQLRGLGLAPEVQEAVSYRGKYSPARFGAVKNVLARKRGTGAGGKALLLMAHYDSRGMTPGASDDGYGVATLLETARALGDSPPLVSDVIFLFTDGEEEGLLGAEAFAAEHPWAADVGAILNFEARGNTGPVLMFQTGDGNGALIRELARAAPHPAATSVSQAIYRRMHNDTDLTIFLPRTPSLNFANVGGFERYHAPTDTVANVDERTLQHHGSYALALARALGGRTLPLPPEPDATYFDVGPFFVHYPGALDLPLAILAAALSLAFVIVGRRRGAIRAAHAALGALGALLAVALGALACGLAWALAERLHPDYRLINAARPGMKELHLAASVTIGIAVALAVGNGLLRRLRAGELFAGAAWVVAAIGIVAARALPGGAYLFVWPVLVASAIALAGRFEDETLAGAALSVALAAPALLLVLPFVPQLFTTFGPAIAPAVGGLVALVTMLCAPAARQLTAPLPRAAPVLVGAIGAALFVAANVAAPFDDAYPRPDTALLAVNADDTRAFWLSPDPAPPPWAASAFAGDARGKPPVPYPLTVPVIAAPAPATSEGGPSITWPDDAAGVARVRVAPPPGAVLLAVALEGVRSARALGRSLRVENGTTELRFFAPPAGGVEVELVRAGPGRVVVHAASQREGFPQGMSPGTRPPGRMPKPGMMPPWDTLLESDKTVVAASSSR